MPSISSEIQIYNLALNAVGERSNVSAPTENSRQAEVCSLWYQPVVEQVLAGAHWPEATKIAYLAQVSAQDNTEWLETEPRPGFAYAYAWPSDALRPRYLSDFSRFLVTSLGDQRVLHSSNPTAALAYTSNLTNISHWSPELRMAIVYGLAAHICMPLSGKPSRAKLLADRANEFLIGARLSAANTGAEQFESLPDWITARGYAGSSTPRYFYPHGALLSVTHVG